MRLCSSPRSHRTDIQIILLGRSGEIGASALARKYPLCFTLHHHTPIRFATCTATVLGIVHRQLIRRDCRRHRMIAARSKRTNSFALWVAPGACSAAALHRTAPVHLPKALRAHPRTPSSRNSPRRSGPVGCPEQEPRLRLQTNDSQIILPALAQYYRFQQDTGDCLPAFSESHHLLPGGNLLSV